MTSLTAEETGRGATRSLSNCPSDRLGQRTPGDIAEMIRQCTSMRALRTRECRNAVGDRRGPSKARRALRRTRSRARRAPRTLVRARCTTASAERPKLVGTVLLLSRRLLVHHGRSVRLLAHVFELGLYLELALLSFQSRHTHLRRRRRQRASGVAIRPERRAKGDGCDGPMLCVSRRRFCLCRCARVFVRVVFARLAARDAGVRVAGGRQWLYLVDIWQPERGCEARVPVRGR
jgi:hypothetical protein